MNTRESAPGVRRRAWTLQLEHQRSVDRWLADVQIVERACSVREFVLAQFPPAAARLARSS